MVHSLSESVFHTNTHTVDYLVLVGRNVEDLEMIDQRRAHCVFSQSRVAAWLYVTNVTHTHMGEESLTAANLYEPMHEP